MYIIFDDQVTTELRAHYTLLELETFDSKHGPRTAYCVIDTQQLSTEDLFYLDKYSEVHAALISNYKEGHFEFCHQALEVLRGKWGGQIDSFYEVLNSRVSVAPKQDSVF